jgi:hypothetical protein
MLAKDWGFGPGILYFSFFGAVEAPEGLEADEGTLLRLLRRRKPLWEDEADGIFARAVRGPQKGTAVLAVWSPSGEWMDVGIVFWPLRFVAPGGHAGYPRYGVRRELPPKARVVRD